MKPYSAWHGFSKFAPDQQLITDSKKYIMKRVILLAALTLTIFSAQVFAQSSTTTGNEAKKEELKTKFGSKDEAKQAVRKHKKENTASASRQAKKDALIEKYGSEEAAKDAANEHKDEKSANADRQEKKADLIEKYGSEEAAKDAAQEHKDEKAADADRQEKKDAMIDKYGSEDAAKQAAKEHKVQKAQADGGSSKSAVKAKADKKKKGTGN